ncbi:uncharacterized protein PHALS_01277 [Plasmopara halstedii]|uniref:Uncharacterized protein n=1 Tax=Plasmopara halstedii TaxID=4781 RepID=A0A0P1AW61_PLAHL|nr:uncharacterized protein PHALS_01277 [Plasmopara halstedii]CEG44954.1 hypothetical protein PHALS_01277 [Plasmopara halstedii]|eukprot:XP_024581323.1 hypothetical protein PHALS_01277 [Plasmopara halstedii]
MSGYSFSCVTRGVGVSMRRKTAIMERGLPHEANLLNFVWQLSASFSKRSIRHAENGAILWQKILDTNLC